MEEAPAARGTLPGPPGVPTGGKRPSLLDRFKIIARGPVKRGSSGTPPPGPATGEQQQQQQPQQWDQATASGSGSSRRGRPPLPLVPTRGASEESVGSNGGGSGGRSSRGGQGGGQGAYHTLAHLAIRHQMNLLSRSRSRSGNGGSGSRRPPQVPHPTVTLQPAGVSGEGAAASSSAPAVPPGSAPPLGAVRASSSLLRWGDYDTASEDEGEAAEDGGEDGSTLSDNNVWDESSDDEDGEGDSVGEMPPVDPAYNVTPKLSARTLALSVTPSRLAERRKGLHISVDDEEEETGSVPGSVGQPDELGAGSGATAAAVGGPLDGSIGGTNTSSSVATTNPALTPYGGAGGPCCDEAPDRKEDRAAASSSCALGFSGSGSLSSQGEAEERIRGAHAQAPHVCKNSPQLAGRSLGQPCQGFNGGGGGGDFVFQPSPALQAARAVRGAGGGSGSQTSSRPRTPVGSEAAGGGEDDELVGRLSDEAEAEGRVVYSSIGENFDLGGFTIGRGGLIRSPRNRRRRRPSLNAGDNFVVLARLGSGNSSAVHKALHVPTMRLVALKALPLYDAERRAQVMRELRILYSNLASIEGARGPCIEPTIEEADEAEEGAGEAEEEDEGLAAALATQASLDDAPASGEGDEKGRKESVAAAGSDVAGASAGAKGEDPGEEEGEREEVEHCPYIVSFYDAFADAKHGCLTLVVEYMNGGSLQDLVNRGGCANEDVLAHISYNVLRGLAYLHERKKIHRDIKPSNLLINSCGFVKIADFGVSRSLDQPGSDLMADTFIGTVGYMSPERITGQGYSFGADIWAFGLSIIACALGAFPLEESTHEPEGGGYWGLVHAVCESPAPALPETFTPAFRSFVSRCLVKDPTQRASSQELLGHPFIASRHHLHKDARGRITEFPESLLDMKLGELDMICRVLALHLVTRQRQQQGLLQQQQQQELAEPGQEPPPPQQPPPQQQQPPPQQQQQNATPDRATMVQRLAEELGLRGETVGEKLEAAFEAIRKQEAELAKGPGPMEEPGRRGHEQGQGLSGAEAAASAIPDMEGPRQAPPPLPPPQPPAPPQEAAVGIR